MRRMLQLMLVISLLISMPSFAEEMGDDNTTTDETMRHVYGDVDLFPIIKFYYPKSNTTIKSVYPELKSDSNDEAVLHFNELVSEKIKQIIAMFMEEVKKNQTVQARLPAKLAKNELYIDFDTSSFNSKEDQIISIRFSIQSYFAGMAHPTHKHEVINYNLGTGNEIELKDLFKDEVDYLSVLSTYSRKALTRRLTNLEMIEQGTSATTDHFKVWNIKPTGLLITFEEAQVAPYVNGAQTVLIPYRVLKDIISPQAPIANCVSHKKRCVKEQVLTGGFIDSLGA